MNTNTLTAPAPVPMLSLRELHTLARQAMRTLPPGYSWNLRPRAETIRAARMAESPLIGRRYYERHMAERFDDSRATTREVERRNRFSRWERRMARQLGGFASRKRRRGW